MTSSLLLFGTMTILTIPGVSPFPFAENATVSWNSTIVTYIDSSPIDLKGVSAEFVPPPFVFDSEGLLSEPCEPQLITNCRGVCPVPPPAAVTDWSSVVRIYYGLQVENMSVWNWPGSPIGNIFEALNHLKASFQTFHASILRDAGVDLKITHVHFLDNGLPGATAVTQTQTIWSSLTPQLATPIEAVMRLTPEGGGGAGGATCRPGLGIGRSGYSFSVNPLGDIERNAVLHVAAQELIRN